MNIRPRILLADDHTMVREGLRSIIEQELGMIVAGQASHGGEVIAQAETLRPDVIVMDVHMPVLNGIDASRRIRERFPDIRIIALSMHRDQDFVAAMFAAGAHAYVLKHCAVDELERAIHCVLSGRKYLSADLADLVIDGYIRNACDERGSAAALTPKERSVLQLIAEGRSTKDIADMLRISISTVESHRAHIMEKTNLHSIAELTRHAIRIGLTEL